MAEVVVGLGILVVAIGGVALLWVISEPAPRPRSLGRTPPPH